MHLFLLRLQLQVLGLDFNSFVVDVEAQIRKRSHVHIRHPDQSKQGNHISSPIRVQEFETGDRQHGSRDVMTEAVFTSEEIEKLASPGCRGRLALPFAVFPVVLEKLLRE